MARVVIVDDSLVVRSIVQEAILGIAGMEVVGFAANGRICLEKMASYKPDLVTLDVEMPVMNGLETVKILKQRYPKVPVIMVSSHTGPGSRAAVSALMAGASDYVFKPSMVGSRALAVEALRAQLAPKIEGLTKRLDSTRPTMSMVPPSSAMSKPQVLVVGASTGGPMALRAMMSGMPADFPLPVLIVQHMPVGFTAILADQLNKVCPLDVREASTGCVVGPGEVVIAQGGAHFEIESRSPRGAVTHLSMSPPINSCRPSVDPLFRSAARVFGPRVLAVVLTGLGADGCKGAGDVKRAGGRIFAQDQQSSVVWGMPGAVVRAELADRILDITEMGSAIVEEVSLVG